MTANLTSKSLNNSPGNQQLRGPLYFLIIGILVLGWAGFIYYRLATGGTLSALLGFVLLPGLLFFGTVITLPAATILIKRLIQKKVA